jgi:hypothetical protein
MHKNAMKCNKTQSKWCINKHGASKIIDTFETYHRSTEVFMKSKNHWNTKFTHRSIDYSNHGREFMHDYSSRGVNQL